MASLRGDEARVGREEAIAASSTATVIFGGLNERVVVLGRYKSNAGSSGRVAARVH